VNEIGVGGSKSGGSHISGDLAAMISGVHDHMQQNVILPVGPVLAFAVFVADRAGKAGFAGGIQVILPKAGQFSSFGFALLQGKVGPDGKVCLCCCSRSSQSLSAERM